MKGGSDRSLQVTNVPVVDCPSWLLKAFSVPVKFSETISSLSVPQTFDSSALAQERLQAEKSSAVS